MQTPVSPAAPAGRQKADAGPPPQRGAGTLRPRSLPLTAMLIIGAVMCQACGEGDRPPGVSGQPGATAQLVDISEAYGLRLQTLTWGGAAADVNGDNRTDLVIVWHRPRPEGLFLNRGGGFARHELGQPADRHDCAVADVDLDGRADIYCTVGARRGKGTGDNNLYMQNADGTFADRATAWGVRDPYGRGRWTTFLDANGDAFPDLFVGNTPGRSDNKTSTNRLYINERGKHFRSAPEYGLDAAEDARCVSAGDVDDDGFDELLVCTSRGLVLYDNIDGRRYVDASASIVSKRRWGRGAFADIDGDGEVDLLTLNRRRVSVLRRSEGRFKERLLDAPLRHGRHVAAGDIDGDGDQDVFVVQASCAEGGSPAGTDESFVFVNDAENGFHRLVAPSQAGCPSDVLTLDVDGDGSTEFLVLNGKGKHRGFVQLVGLRHPSNEAR